MRLFFADLSRIQARAKASVKTRLTSLKKWWSKKYKLPENHPLFENRSIALHEEEFLVDLWLRKSDIEGQMEAGDLKSNEGLEMLNAIHELLGVEAESSDDLVDEWEAAIARGEIPDFNKKV